MITLISLTFTRRNSWQEKFGMLTKKLLNWLVKNRLADRKLPELVSFGKAKTVMMLINQYEQAKAEELMTPKCLQLFEGKRIIMVVLHHQNKVEPVTSPDKKIHIINLFPKDFFGIGWPRKSFKTKLQDVKADLILSFDSMHDVRLQLASTESKTGFMVGLNEPSMISFYDLTFSVGAVTALEELFAIQTKYLTLLNGENDA
jgi:hypothetical protein